jgi:hypothetical protein
MFLIGIRLSISYTIFNSNFADGRYKMRLNIYREIGPAPAKKIPVPSERIPDRGHCPVPSF